MKTKTIFLIDKPEGNLPCDVFAFFPADPYKKNDKNMFNCYAHVGQHSGCHIDYAKECELATPEQYKDLAAELTRLGYNLEIINQLPQ